MADYDFDKNLGLPETPETKFKDYPNGPYKDLFKLFTAIRTLARSIGSFITDAPSDGSIYGRKDGAWEVVSGGGGSLPTVNTQTGTAYTLVLGDAENWVDMSNAAPNTVTVPPHSAVAFPVGTSIQLGQKLAGQTTVAPGAGVIVDTASTLKLNAQYSHAQLFQIAVDFWRLFGDLAPGSGGPSDPFFANVVLLMHFDTGTLFKDWSSYAHNPTLATGAVTADTTTYKYGTASAKCGPGGMSAGLATSEWNLSSGDFTIECWINTNSATTFQYLYAQQSGTSFYPANVLIANTGAIWFLGFDSSNVLAYNIASTGTLTPGVWYHIACVRSGNTFTIYINGNPDGTATFSGALHYSASDTNYVAVNGSLGFPVDGYMDDFRLTQGVARYTGAFTPPTGPFPDH